MVQIEPVVISTREEVYETYQEYRDGVRREDVILGWRFKVIC